ncbi:hypothetical protein [Ruminococcus flavefaciens]|jgi:hypothetical protein|uniref:hypothetical protein n=1 Tax=Ruminococcus flavefaciens TaxID=1265 RepID=UPI000B2302DE|nr:hypothetical protein [Ruminococcus flavefaciens]
MDKFVPYDKMSKKEQKKIDSAKRGSWNGVDPATKVVESDKKRYKRKPKHKNEEWE